MIYLVTGVPGSGKTLYAIKLILDFIKEGRTVYADIDGLNIDGVLPAPDDWRDTPDGSVVVYDECQQKFGPDGSGRSKDTRVQALEVHRHTGHDIVFITQRERLLHTHIRDLVGKHFHIQRQYGSHVVKIFKREEVIQTSSRSVLERCDQELWKYDKSLFDCYKSATVHTHKFRIPTKLKAMFGGIAVLIVAVVFMFTSASDFFSGHSGFDNIVASAEAGDSGAMVVEVTRGRRPLNGCVVWSKETECRCHDIDGKVAEWMDFGSCMAAARGSTLNFSSHAGYEKRGRDEPEAKARSAGSPGSASSQLLPM
jgi:zona occludens toxin (predicted ATPase)